MKISNRFAFESTFPVLISPKATMDIITEELCYEDCSKYELITVHIIREHEQKLFPLADEDGKKSGWTLDYNFLQKLTEIAEEKSGEQISMEGTEAILLAFRELPEAYKEGGKEMKPSDLIKQ